MRYSTNVLFASVLLLLGAHCIEAVEYMNGTYGRFKSPNYPGVYGNNLNRTWRIEVREGFRIKLKFNAFDLEDSYDPEIGSCVYDYVKVFERNRTIGRFCGNYIYSPWDAPRPGKSFYSRNNSVTVEFISDFSNEGISPTGFSAHYVQTDINECEVQRLKLRYMVEDWDKYVYCDHFCINTLGSYYCSCRRGYTLHSNRHTCVASFCENQVLEGDQGVIKTPEYPERYAKLTHCTWDIRVRDGLSVNMLFMKSFEIEKHPDEGCVYDILRITYGNRGYSYCGTVSPQNGSLIETNTRNVKVEFITDMAIEERGFRMVYNTTRIRCLTQLTAPANGNISVSLKGYHEFEDVANFTCNLGYDLIGQERLECLGNGRWSNSVPTCRIISCGDPEKLLSSPHSHIVNYTSAEKTFLEELTVKCDPWYEMTGGTKRWICKENKEWVENSDPIALNPPDNLPVCTPICGERSIKEEFVDGLISDAKVVKKRGAWPWMALVDLGGGKDGTDFCGGSLIDERTVVTAAHCVLPLDKSFQSVTVWLGMNDRVHDKKYLQAYKVEDWHVHQAFADEYGAGNRKYSFDSDIAVLKLNDSARLSYHVRPICLPLVPTQKQLPQNYYNENKKAVIIGWGRNESGNPSEVLMKARIPVANFDDCVRGYQVQFSHISFDMVTENMICAGYPHGLRDACKGDSGGPLMFKDDNDKWFMNGIVSFGDERFGGKLCGRGKTFGVYTKVDNFVDWMSTYLGDKGL